MANDETMRSSSSIYTSLNEYLHLPYDGENRCDEDEGDMGTCMSHLFIESSDDDADFEDDGHTPLSYSGKDVEGSPDDRSSNTDVESGNFASLPGKKGRIVREIGRRSGERLLDRRAWPWEMSRCGAAIDEEQGMVSSLGGGDVSHSCTKGDRCRLYLRPRRGSGCICMDMEEIKACKDLGLELPSDWTVEIPPGCLSGRTVDTGSGGSSPTSNWRISSPGDDPGDVKARLKVWAQAVALASSASCFGS